MFSQVLGKQKIWKGMHIAHSILTLDWGSVLWFSSPFDLSFTMVPLKFGIGLGKVDFLAL